MAKSVSGLAPPEQMSQHAIQSAVTSLVARPANVTVRSIPRAEAVPLVEPARAEIGLKRPEAEARRPFMLGQLQQLGSDAASGQRGLNIELIDKRAVENEHATGAPAESTAPQVSIRGTTRSTMNQRTSSSLWMVGM
jgi:hypothetical protein